MKIIRCFVKIIPCIFQNNFHLENAFVYTLLCTRCTLDSLYIMPISLVNVYVIIDKTALGILFSINARRLVHVYIYFAQKQYTARRYWAL